MLSIVMMLFCVWGYTQELPTIIPPSPEATSLAKFTEVPVSHYTGLPNISIPIYEIESSGTNIPISLSYHARGIRVEEIASRVGIGWTLNAGGIISRQVRGSIDEGALGYYTKNFYSDFGTNESTRSYVYTESLSGAEGIDLVPDQFNFQFPGRSGKFIFDQKTKKPLIQSYSDIKIEYSGFKKWIITTSNGYKYYFGEPENNDISRYAKDVDISHNYVYANDGLSDLGKSGYDIINSWHLIDIVSPDGKKIHFNYEKENLTYYRRSYDKYDKTTNGASSFFSKVSSTQFQLKEIIFETGKVIFNRPTIEREDLKGSHQLESIEIKDLNDHLIKKYKLIHSYSNDELSNNVLSYLKNIEPSAKKRLFLDAIKQVSKSGEEKHYYAFEYTNKDELPNRFSNAQDLWGYYNGKDNGSFLTFYNYDRTVNREVDEFKSKVGLITKVINPTKGYSKFTFEPNKAVPPIYFHNLYFKNPNQTSSSSKSTNLLKSPEYKIANGDYEKTFSVGDNAANFRSQISFFGSFGTCSTTANISECKYQVSIVGINGTSYYRSIYMGMHDYPTMLSAGDYKFVVKVIGEDDPYDFQNGFSIALSWDEIVVSEPELTYSGGNRIKEIEINSIDNGKIIKSYEYLTPEGKSSGLLYSLPTYYFKNETFDASGAVTTAEAYGARPGSPYTYEQGNHVGYSHVTEYLNNENEQGRGGKINYKFTSMPDDGEFYKPPYTLPINNEWLRGKPIEITYFKKQNNNYYPVKKEEYSYSYAGLPNYKALTIPINETPEDPLLHISNKKQHHLPLITFKLNENNPLETNHNDYKIYNLVGGTSNLISKKETSYFQGKELISSIDYLYNYDNHYQIVSTKTTNSKGEVLKTKNYYTPDVTSVNSLGHDDLTPTEKAIIDQLKLQNRIAAPIQIETFKNNILQTTQRTNYKNFNNIYLPEIFQTSKEEQSLEDRVVYHSYDSKGNPTEVSKKDGVHIVYIWGYNKTQPIAKIENATLSDIPSALISEIETAANQDSDIASENSLRESLNKLRDTNVCPLFSNAQIITFTYDPLIGVTSITDPRGQTIYYQYDDFNRLEFIKDADGNLLKEHKYHYKN
ncbi:RHS repeat domain-containing protein [Tenacibaculum singaporense]|uniref:RHS repeat domain-containing protein n=1 Tax=Tenacibaculum singaporense TaxID=2358479 RepID=UPI000F66C74A|nr:RHS repeat domain-containing protein [Tenacibaculum singaporense]RSC92065.1 hypothetical protein EI424_14875 [Tenacibaculum singaporense]